MTFFLIWADLMGWDVPLLHVRICRWLQARGRIAVLRVFRGAAKSTIVAVYQAWRLYRDRACRLLDQAADDPTAYKLSRDTRAVLRRHPLCKGMLGTGQTAAGRFDVVGNPDARNASVTAAGVLSNTTSARADEAVFDDVEVPRNCRTVEARETLRGRLTEATHILVPGGRKLYIGTPHTHDSIYDEQIAAGADELTIPLFEAHVRYEGESAEKQRRFPFNFAPRDDGLYVFLGPRLAVEGEDYRVEGRAVVMDGPPGITVDIYAQCAWPERFTRAEIAHRRKECRTMNEWDSQYQLKARPIHEIRLDPSRIVAYAVEPEIHLANGETRMMLGGVRIVSAAAWWDCALGKVKRDASALCVVFTDEAGRLYWHTARGLTGEVDEQCEAIRALAVTLQLPAIDVETNGPGGFVPPILRKHLAGTGCAVREQWSSENKDRRILDGLEPPLSGRFLWAHVDALDVIEPQMRDWIPGAANQPDDYLDAGAGAIRTQPVRIGKVIGNPRQSARHHWQPATGTYDVAVDLH